MSAMTVILALVAAVVAWKVLTGFIKLATIAIVVGGTLWFLNNGGLAI